MNFVADLKKIPKDQKKSMVEEVMEMVKITDMKNRLIKNLSKVEPAGGSGFFSAGVYVPARDVI